MQKFSKLAKASSRGFAAQAKIQPSNVHSDVSEEGIKICSMTKPNISNGISRVALVVRGGPVYEEANALGLSHLIRRSFGLSSDQYSAVNLNRHIEFMGGNAKVTGTKEHLIYTIDCAANLIPRAAELISFMASDNAYYPWEIKTLANKLMAYDIEFLNRIDADGLCSQLLHEAAFGVHPDGTKLGRSLYSSMDKVGTFSEEQIFNFHKNMFNSSNISIGLVNMSDSLDSIDLLREFKDNLKITNTAITEAAPKHSFVGNDLRRDINNQSNVYVKLAYYVPSGRSSTSQMLALALASRALGSQRVLYGIHKDSILGKTAGAEGFDESLVEAEALYQPYSKHSLFGFSLKGSCAKATNARLEAIMKTLKTVSTSGLSDVDFKKAKNQLLMDYSEASQNPYQAIVENTIDNLENGSVNKLEDTKKIIQAMTLEEVNTNLKKILNPGFRAMAVTGSNTSRISPLNVLPK